MTIRVGHLIRPTFPLDETALNRGVMLRKLFHPVTLGVVALCVGLSAMTESVFGGLVLSGLAALALGAAWRRLTPGLRENVARGMIVRSNREQDRLLSAAVGKLRQHGQRAYARTLRRVLLRKQSVESTLHRDGELTLGKQDVERLVDLACDGAYQRIASAVVLDARLGDVLTSGLASRLEEYEAARSRLLWEIRRVYDALCATQENLHVDGLATMPAPTLPGDTARWDHTSLVTVLDHLEEENDIVRRARERVAAELLAA